MKLILTHDVDGLGGPGDVVEVKDGYGRNYLVPQRMAIGWSAGAEKQINNIRRARSAREIRGRDHALEVKAQLEASPVRLPARAGQSGRLFGSITAAEIAAAVRSNGGPLLEKRSVAMAAPIRSIGHHDVEVRLHPTVVALVKIEVVAA